MAHSTGMQVMRTAQKRNSIRRMVRSKYRYESERLQTNVCGIEFDNPVGVAAGFDKNAKVVPMLQSLGFGYVEIGTVTPFPQDGNQKPRMFRLRDDNALINRLGFNNDGMKRVNERLQQYDVNIPVGVNIGKMNDSNKTEAVEDYRRLVKNFGSQPSYYTVNVSCPNTDDKYNEQSPEHVECILAEIVGGPIDDTPVFIKIGPDEDEHSLVSIANIVRDVGIDGIIATNTTENRAGELSSNNRVEQGGLSGEPLESASNDTIRVLYQETDCPIIGVGGVRDGASAYRKIRNGASLVQLYTGLVYNGPSTSYTICKELDELLESDRHENIEEAVGVNVE